MLTQARSEIGWLGLWDGVRMPEAYKEAGLCALFMAVAGGRGYALGGSPAPRGRRRRLAGAASEFAELLERGVPVITTINGKGVVDERHPLALGREFQLPGHIRVTVSPQPPMERAARELDATVWTVRLHSGLEFHTARK